ncbi:MAG: RDD family protein [Terracidiphilus sp.]
MSERREQRRFQAHESARMEALNGLPLACFWQRWLGHWIDLILVIILWWPLEFLWRHFLFHENAVEMKWDYHEPGNIVAMVLYWGLFNYFGNGRTPGKWIARTQAVSLTSERLGLWQSFERGLGYGAAVLECGVGFLQFFWDRNRMCAQDRLAETIVVDRRKRANPTLEAPEVKVNSSTETAEPLN